MTQNFRHNSDLTAIVVGPQKKKPAVKTQEEVFDSGEHLTFVWRAVWLILAIGLFGLFLWGIRSWVLHSNAFLLKSITVRGNRILEKENILKNVSFKKNMRLTDVELSGIEGRLMKNPYLKSVVVFRRFPSTLEIEVEERSPVAYVSGKKLWMVDDEGVILPPLLGGETLGLPVITHTGKFQEKIGEAVKNKKLRKAVWLLSMMKTLDKNLYYQVNNVDYSVQKGMVVYLNKRSFPLYFGDSPAVRQIAYMQAILKKLKRERRVANVQYIDLRFENQVVVK
ncbi:cell division protein FtsQ [bacterium BMS3Abin05]|nr:cell division protein FtsQ [bacterium BMS3Abin05]GBE27089.1 cell division protein FtsQ [bacterium BMS3Bbin03]HDK36060.1 FtsQ-type POTRA domain-containing protein [Bacteroidota bacterium]